MNNYSETWLAFRNHVCPALSSWGFGWLMDLRLYFKTKWPQHLSLLTGRFWWKLPVAKQKSAHTALAVKACLLGGNSYTKCSITFVNIAVAISALAGGGPKTVSHRDQTPKTVSHRDQNTVVFSTFFEDFWVSERKRVLKWKFWVILVAFRQWKNGQKWKKHCT